MLQNLIGEEHSCPLILPYSAKFFWHSTKPDFEWRLRIPPRSNGLVAAKADTDSIDNWGDFGRLELHLHNYCGGKALSGVSYIDLRLYSHHVKNYREYGKDKITCPLIKGAKHILRFRTMPIKGSYLIGNIGAYLTTDSVNIRGHKLLPFRPTVVSAKGRAQDNPQEYALIEDTITAQRGEQYIILGNFDNDRQLPRKKFHGFYSLTGFFGPL